MKNTTSHKYQYLFTVCVESKYGEILSISLDGMLESVVNCYTKEFQDVRELPVVMRKLYTIVEDDKEVKEAIGVDQKMIDQFVSDFNGLCLRAKFCDNVEGIFSVTTPSPIDRDVIASLIDQHAVDGTITEFLKGCDIGNIY